MLRLLLQINRTWIMQAFFGLPMVVMGMLRTGTRQLHTI